MRIASVRINNFLQAVDRVAVSVLRRLRPAFKEFTARLNNQQECFRILLGDLAGIKDHCSEEYLAVRELQMHMLQQELKLFVNMRSKGLCTAQELKDVAYRAAREIADFRGIEKKIIPLRVKKREPKPVDRRVEFSRIFSAPDPSRAAIASCLADFEAAQKEPLFANPVDVVSPPLKPEPEIMPPRLMSLDSKLIAIELVDQLWNKLSCFKKSPLLDALVNQKVMTREDFDLSDTPLFMATVLVEKFDAVAAALEKVRAYEPGMQTYFSPAGIITKTREIMEAMPEAAVSEIIGDLRLEALDKVKTLWQSLPAESKASLLQLLPIISDRWQALLQDTLREEIEVVILNNIDEVYGLLSDVMDGQNEITMQSIFASIVEPMSDIRYAAIARIKHLLSQYPAENSAIRDNLTSLNQPVEAEQLAEYLLDNIHSNAGLVTEGLAAYNTSEKKREAPRDSGVFLIGASAINDQSEAIAA